MEIEDLELEERGVVVGLRPIVMLVVGVCGMRGAVMGVEAPQWAGARCARRKEVDGAWLVMDSHDIYERIDVSRLQGTRDVARVSQKVLEVERGRRLAAAKPAAEPHGDKPRR